MKFKKDSELTKEERDEEFLLGIKVFSLLTVVTILVLFVLDMAGVL